MHRILEQLKIKLYNFIKIFKTKKQIPVANNL